MKSFQTEILTPQKTVFSGQAEALVLKGALGYFGILAGHAPFIARLAAGKLKLTKDNKESVYLAGPGFVQISPPAKLRAGKGRVSILLDEIRENQ